MVKLDNFLKSPVYRLMYFFHSWPAACIHGDKSQPERDWVLQGKYSSTNPYLYQNLYMRLLVVMKQG
jgi:hypothetical protein